MPIPIEDLRSLVNQIDYEECDGEFICEVEDPDGESYCGADVGWFIIDAGSRGLEDRGEYICDYHYYLLIPDPPIGKDASADPIKRRLPP